MKRKNFGSSKFEAGKLLFQILVMIMLYEAIILALFYAVSIHELWSIIFDPILLTIPITPTLYFIVIQTLKNKIKEHKLAEEV